MQTKAYNSRIMLSANATKICPYYSKLCYHNWSKPTHVGRQIVVLYYFYILIANVLHRGWESSWECVTREWSIKRAIDAIAAM